MERDSLGYYPVPGEPQPNMDSGNALFMNSTISKDDTVGDFSIKRDMLAKFSNRPGGEPQWTSPFQESQPNNAVEHTVVGSRHPRIRRQDDSDYEFDVSDRQQRSKWPENEANEMAQWRRKAIEKRDIFDRTAAAERRNSIELSDDQVHGNTNETIDTSKACDEPLMGASAVNAQSESSETWAPTSTSLVQPASDAENARLLNEMDWKKSLQGPHAVSDPEGTAQDLSVALDTFSVCSAKLDRGSKSFSADQAEHKHDRALDESRPTMSESLNAITERFLNIDVLDERQDISRFIAYLLDTVELLSSRVAFLQAKDANGRMDDIIAGKGNGLIILLHGSPGTGKTLTAESVAEIAEKPLYRVTCGDIGTDPKEVENYLETVLYLGKTGDCVLLLDEADVFLEERTMADLQRNSLVSSEKPQINQPDFRAPKILTLLVFLRTLEYYDGILILTSNRVGTFDEAFKSRIQVAIHYESLTKKSRRAIWRNFFDMIEESQDEDANMAELERRLDELAAHEMNGRQIRNALLTARQLAKHEGERLDWKHLSQAMKTAADFNKYLKTVKGHSDDQWAREEMLR